MITAFSITAYGIFNIIFNILSLFAFYDNLYLQIYILSLFSSADTCLYQPVALSISVTPSIFLSLSISLLSSSLPDTTNPKLIVAIFFLFTRLFMNLTSMLASVNNLDISTIRPFLLPANMLISALYFSSLFSVCSHSASMSLARSLAGKFSMLIQSVLWIEIPLPLVTKPTISSPGTGLQHLENLTATSWIPLTTIPPLPFLLSFSFSLLSLAAICSSACLSVISDFFVFKYSSLSLLTIYPSFKAPCPTAAIIESQSL